MTNNEHITPANEQFDFTRNLADTVGFWELDRNLPRWARRSNPIVRRHLGGFLSAPLPQLDVLLRLYLVQASVVLLSILFPMLLELIALVGLVSFVIMPFIMAMYGWALFTIGRDATTALINERRTGALDTLRATPLTLQSILLSKVAASLWQQAINLETIIMATAIFSLPPITIQHATLYPPELYTVEPRLLTIIGLATAMFRVVLEPLMIGALGILAGTVADLRVTAITWVTVLGVFYFVLINLPRMLILTWSQRLIVESVLPVALPILITLVALAAARNLLQRE